MLNLNRGQWITVAMLTVGYTGFYLCRSNLSVATPALMEDLRPLGIDKKAIGGMISLSVTCYAIGKVINGYACDLLGGRRTFLFAMLGAIIATFGFALSGGLGAFTLFWCLNRFAQSAGWGGMMKISAERFAPNTYGRVVAIISLSYLFGDALARQVLGELIGLDLGWRALFWVPGAVLAVLAVCSFFVLRGTGAKAESLAARDAAFSDPPRGAHNPAPEGGQSAGAGDTQADGAAQSRGIIGPLLRTPTFWVICAISLSLTLIREAFNNWTPTYLVEVGGLTEELAASRSSIFPFFGGISVLFTGWLFDRLSGRQRGIGIVLMLAPVIGLLWLLGPGRETWAVSTLGGSNGALLIIGAIGFLMIGPYSLLAGAMSLDLGRGGRAATAAGLIDGAGYLGAILSGRFVGGVAQNQGWSAAFEVLAGVSVLAAVAAVAYAFMSRRAGPGA